MEELKEVAEVTISYKPNIKPNKRVQIKSPKDLQQLLVNFIGVDKIEYREVFCVVLLDKTLKILGVIKISEGGTTGTVVDPKIVFQVALKANANQIVLCHNHPSGQLLPSGADIQITKRIIRAGKVLGIAVLDHLIVSAHGIYSMHSENDVKFYH
ncbi:JAB domain-containing protein [Sinomicrobium kalidii]|uniref:JAB domain-containing protein n=1 Tax=Sinomicrobium kalidii TaxID=2900738 RepID=UPI001E2B580B|nr:JAB domain-containing protein [Sinomicrobium kalidii]UGU14233.1 JAB domain-containing protein [Sinomicrobium kalidii]